MPAGFGLGVDWFVLTIVFPLGKVLARLGARLFVIRNPVGKL